VFVPGDTTITVMSLKDTVLSAYRRFNT